MGRGKFVISLDFELHWGAAEKWDLKRKKDYFLTTRRSIPLVLSLFKKYNIHATWATVGFLFAKNKQQLLAFRPTEEPTYSNTELSYYNLLDNNEVGNDEDDDPYHYAYSLIELILKAPNQEIGTHTFAHFYCNEKGQDKNQFNADLQAAQAIAKANFNIELKSLVFPRNQFNSEYIDVAKQNGIKVIRSNPYVWFWKSNSKLARIARAFDTLMPISSTLTFKVKEFRNNEVLLLPASRFLRPFRENEKFLQIMKLRRIKKEMYFAAKKNHVYHLWWHPHNFGYSLEENLLYLEDILSHYKQLNEKYNFCSSSMFEMYD